MSEVKLQVIDLNGAAHQVCADSGDNLMHVLRDQVDLAIGTCGGEISCGTCLVQMNGDWAARIAEAGEFEAEMIDALGAENTSRLACQITLDDAADTLQIILLHEE